MSEQSGPITREQVERAIDAAYDCNAQGVNAALGAFWYEREDIPADVRDGWRQVGYLGLRIALTRWHAELAAAEPVRRVARWDAYALAYAAKNADGAVHYYQHADQAKADGYEIEGGPEPVRDWKSDRAIAAIWPTPKPAEDSPERLRERREALGLSTEQAADLIKDGWCDEDIARCEDPRSVCDPRARTRYAAALSAEEARRAAKAKPVDIGYVPTDRERYPERPAPRFKVGDRVTSGLGGPWKIGRVEWGRLVPEADCDEWVYHHASGNVSACESVLALAWTPTPASPPAPEVVDVPQPAPLPKTVAHFYTIRALPEPHRVSWNMPGDGPQWVRVNDALWLHVDDLRAMLADIDAQQGGAS